MSLIIIELTITENLKLLSTAEDALLKNIEVTKAGKIDQSRGKFLKDGGAILSKAINELFNLSMALKSFSDGCKIAVKSLLEKGSKTDPSNYSLISLLIIS